MLQCIHRELTVSLMTQAEEQTKAGAYPASFHERKDLQRWRWHVVIYHVLVAHISGQSRKYRGSRYTVMHQVVEAFAYM